MYLSVGADAAESRFLSKPSVQVAANAGDRVDHGGGRI
jgi:hypothetical protein